MFCKCKELEARIKKLESRPDWIITDDTIDAFITKLRTTYMTLPAEFIHQIVEQINDLQVKK